MSEITSSRMVIKADGSKQPFSLEKLTNRINRLTEGLNTQFMMIQSCIDKVVKYAHNGKFAPSY